MSLPGQSAPDAIDEQVQRLIDRGFDEESARAAVETLQGTQGAMTDSRRDRDDHDDRDEHDHGYHDRDADSRARGSAHTYNPDEDEDDRNERAEKDVRQTQAGPKPSAASFKMKPLHWAIVAVVGMGVGFGVKTLKSSANPAPVMNIGQTMPGQAYPGVQAGAQPPLPPNAQAGGGQFDQGFPNVPPQYQQGYASAPQAPQPPSYASGPASVQSPSFDQQSAQQRMGYPDSGMQPTVASQTAGVDGSMPTPDQYAASQPQPQVAQRAHVSAPQVPQTAARATIASGRAASVDGEQDGASSTTPLSSSDVAALSAQIDALEAKIRQMRTVIQASNGTQANNVTVRKTVRHSAPRQIARSQKQQAAPQKMMVLAADSNSIVLHTASGEQTYRVGDTLPTGAKYGGYSDGKIHTSRGDVTVE